MAVNGRALVSAVLIAVALALFAPAFADAATGASFDDWKYGGEVQMVFEYVPLLLGAAALVILASPFLDRT